MTTSSQTISGNNLNATEQSWLTDSPFYFDVLNTYGDINKTSVQRHSKQDTVEFAVLMVNVVLSLCATLSNGAILLASKFSSGGDTPALIYVRSFCVADCMAGVYGLMKVSFVLGRPQWINCFLSENILFSSLMASNFMLVNLSTNTLLHLIKPHKMYQLMDKKSTITNMVFLWNGAFLIGFAPQMGWHLTNTGCKFFTYFDVYYITFTMLIFVGCTISTLVLLVRIDRILISSQPRTSQHRYMARIQTVLFTCRLDLCSQFISQFPLFLYLLLNCHVCALYTTNSYPDLTLLFLIPPILIKSVVAAAIHGSRTTQIWQVLTSFILGHMLQLRTKHMHLQRKYVDHPLSPRETENQPPHVLSIVNLPANTNHLHPNSTFNSYETPDGSDDETVETVATPRGSIDSFDSIDVPEGIHTTRFTVPRTMLSPVPMFRPSDWQPCPVHGFTITSPNSSARSSMDFTSVSTTGHQQFSNLPICELKCVLIHCRSCPAHPNNLAHNSLNSDIPKYFGSGHTTLKSRPHISRMDPRYKLRKKSNCRTQHQRHTNLFNSNRLSPAILSAHNLSQEDLANRRTLEWPSGHKESIFLSPNRPHPVQNGHGNPFT